MRSKVAWSERGSCCHKKRHQSTCSFPLPLPPCPQERPFEDRMRRQPSANQETLTRNWISQNLDLGVPPFQPCEKINFSYLSHLGHGILFWQLTNNTSCFTRWLIPLSNNSKCWTFPILSRNLLSAASTQESKLLGLHEINLIHLHN